MLLVWVHLAGVVTVLQHSRGAMLRSTLQIPTPHEVNLSHPFPARTVGSCFGSGHAALTVRSDWRAALMQLHADLNTSHVRFHGILELVEFTAKEAENGGTGNSNSTLPFTLDFTRVDAVYDWMIRTAGVVPYVELSFMPLPLASGLCTSQRIVPRVSGTGTPVSSALQARMPTRHTSPQSYLLIYSFRFRLDRTHTQDWMYLQCSTIQI